MKKKSLLTGIQVDIFKQLETPTMKADFIDLDIQHEIRGALSHSLKLYKQHGGSRDRLVDAMNLLMPDLPKNKQITIRKINGWMATSAEDTEFPLRYLASFCAATQCDLPLRVVANSLMLELSDKRDLLAAELGKKEIEKSRLARETRELKTMLGN